MALIYLYQWLGETRGNTTLSPFKSENYTLKILGERRICTLLRKLFANLLGLKIQEKGIEKHLKTRSIPPKG